ncbi:hypothetical protein [Bacillus sp. Brlt_9]|uniref:hypothetical protein n=1 Tax=Bacillus sp. Brlt_9 TaxID=3110916 RepID=UPI003F7CB34F
MNDYFNGAKNLRDISVAARDIKLELKIPEEMPKIIPEFGSSLIDTFSNESTMNMLKERLLRESYVKIGMFALVSWKWINPLSEWIGERKCLEVMAGRGWLSHGLRTKGIDVIATDDFSWNGPEYIQTWTDTVTEVEKLDAIDAVKKYGTEIDILIMSWPYMDDTAYRVIKCLNEVNPKALVIYIGEKCGGCTANDEFFNSFSIIEDPKFEIAASHFQSWHLFFDKLFLGKYKNN